MLAALAMGRGFSVAGIGLPTLIAIGLGWLTELALPIALLAVGASLSPEFEGFDAVEVGRVTLLKTIVMPLLAFGVFTALAVPLTTLQAGVVMKAMSAAVSRYVYASELGGNEALTSVNVFITTAVSFVLVFARIPFLH